MNDFSIWSPVEFKTGYCATWNLGQLCLWTERYELEWHVLPVYGGDGVNVKPTFALRKKPEKPESSDWVHYVLHEGKWALPLPVMMDRPVVIRPDRRLVLLPGERAKFFLALPLWFRLMIGYVSEASASRKLNEFPIFPMANAWFGDTVAGELCYFTTARLFSNFDQIPESQVHAVCPLWINNESDRDLSFDRICLHTEFLGIYRGSSRFWTNEVNVVFKGPDQETRIQPSRSAPVFDGAMKLVTESRQPIENWHFKKTFNLLKHFTGF